MPRRRQDLRVADGTFGIESRLSFEARADAPKNESEKFLLTEKNNKKKGAYLFPITISIYSSDEF